MNENKTNINWYPGHMAKTKRNITDIISMVDIVIEVIDARIPFSSRIPDLAKTTRNKQNIIVFNKYDLCDQIETDKWIEKYGIRLSLSHNQAYRNSQELYVEENHISATDSS